MSFVEGLQVQSIYIYIYNPVFQILCFCSMIIGMMYKPKYKTLFYSTDLFVLSEDDCRSSIEILLLWKNLFYCGILELF